MASHSDQTFQQLLLKLSRAAFDNSDASHVVESFCRLAREFFHASGVYFWSATPQGELIGAEADGFQSERFRGLKLQPTDSSVALEAVQNRRTIFVNDVDIARYPLLAEYNAQSVLAAPLLVAGEVTGAVEIVRDPAGDRFDDDSAAKATIL